MDSADRDRLADLAGLSPADVVACESRVDVAAYERGALVFRRGDPGVGMCLVLDGQVEIEIDGVTVGLVRPGEFFGELALFTAGLRTADARVVVAARVAHVDREAWEFLAARSPRLVAALCERLSRQLRASAERTRPTRIVVACEASGDWLRNLVASLERQFPRRALRVLDVGGEALGRTLAELTTPDLLILATAPSAVPLAARQLTRADEATWTIEPGYGGRTVDRVSARTSAEALDRVARRLAGGTVGLALGAGGAYGFAHIGLVQALEAAGVPIDDVAGTSMGAIIGALAAAEVSGDRMQAFAVSVAERWRGIVLRDLDLLGRTLITGRGVMRVLAELPEVRDATFESLRIPFVAIATDIGTGAEIVIAEGPLLAGIQPSFTMPGIFPPCERDGRRLVDGAMVNPVPVDRVRALGADVVIALQPIPPLQAVAQDPLGGMLGRARWLTNLLPLSGVKNTIENLDVSMRSFQTLWQRLSVVSAATADVAVAPDLKAFWFLQFGAAGEIAEVGRRAAAEVVGRRHRGG